MHCSHEGFHTGEGRYCRETGQVRYVMVCDDCAAELRVVHAEPYRPSFDPDGNRRFLASA